MSWFDASGLANIAKSALKEAQRTIDKALDIKEEEGNPVPANTPIDTNSDDFFGTWGITQSGNIKENAKNEEEPHRPANKLQASLWGSFTGSFFDAQKGEPGSSEGLDDSIDLRTEQFSGSKLVVQQSDDANTLHEIDEISSLESPESGGSSGEDQVKRREKTSSSSTNNRLSVVSNDGKNSSESVELITYSTECTSPESDALSTTSTSNRQTSESVEVLGINTSLTSPSSIEIITPESVDPDKQPDEFASPLESPIKEEPMIVPHVEKQSPDPSVEVIPEDQEESVAEDTMSYTSISESTSATVLESAFSHLKPQKMLKDTYNNPSMTESDVSLSPDKSHSFTEAITRAPSRGGMHLPLTQVNQVLIDTQPQSISRQDLSNILKNTNIIDIPQEEVSVLTESIDEGSQSDRTVIATDSLIDSSSDTSLTETSNSAYLKNLIEDAIGDEDKAPEPSESHFMDLSQSMIDSSQTSGDLGPISITQLGMPPRESSPASSESRSDLVKIGSSGHTSGDELETTTSSDIEIISSPNGDSSSTQSRHQSPAKGPCGAKQAKGHDAKVELLCKMTLKKAKGHNRELSEASSVSDDSSELDRLIKRVAEMTDILETRESRLIDVNRRNAELQELNFDLKLQLDSVLNKQTESADLSQVTDEYTQRLSALERKFQQAIRERDTLRKQLEQTKQEAASRMSKQELESLIGEKDETIKELREEGEKLSKQQLQHSNIIKKLRAKEKENETTIKNLKETVENLSSEADRLKRSLQAKDEVERSQIEAVHQLTAKNKRVESDVTKLQSQVEDLTQKYEVARKSLDAAKKELIDKTRASSELLARDNLLESLENEKKQTESQNAAILDQLEDLRLKLRQSEVDFVKKEQMLRRENGELLRRLEDAETRNEELSQSVLEVSKPLVRQLESLQATHTMKVANFEKIEQELSLKLNELQRRFQNAQNSEKSSKEETLGLRTRVSELEGQLGTFGHQLDMAKMQLEQQKAEQQMAEQDLKRQIGELKENLKSEHEKSQEQMKKITNLQEQLLSLEKSANDEERKKGSALQEQSTPNVGETSSRTASSSPTLSLGKVSVADSLSSSFWSQDESFDVGQAPRYTNMFEMQMLQTNLKQREGEVQQLQWELNRREQERSLLNSEISTLLTKVDELETKVSNYDTLKTQLEDLQKQYDTLCQLFGEKVEENEELKLDLEDVKDMYKGQIDELLKQQKQSS